MERLKSQYIALRDKVGGSFNSHYSLVMQEDHSADSKPFLHSTFDSGSRSVSPFRTRRILTHARTRTLLFYTLSILSFTSLFGVVCWAIRRNGAIPNHIRLGNYVEQAYLSDPFFSPPQRSEYLEKVAAYNLYTPPAVGGLRTPMFVPFTRNHNMLEQTITSYIAAGWPPNQIIVVDNSGTMNANQRKLLSANNPFYLDIDRLTNVLGVGVLRTPTLLTFAQLQNFLIAQALNHNWDYYFWSHMDVVIMSDEKELPYMSAYQRLINDLGRHLQKWERISDKNAPRHLRHKRDWQDEYPDNVEISDWAVRFYAYDWLTLVNTRAMDKMAGFDNFIPYYTTDCDFRERIKMHGLEISEGKIGKIFDVATVHENVTSVFFPEPDEDPVPGTSKRFRKLSKNLSEMQDYKNGNGRNVWQDQAKGGKGLPWTYNPEGFQKAWWNWDWMGREIYKKKWRLKEGEYKGYCVSLVKMGKKLDDTW